MLVKPNKDAITLKPICSDGNTVLHIAVAANQNDFVKKLLQHIKDKETLKKNRVDGRTALHVAAIVGNTYAAKLLVKKQKKLFWIPDKKSNIPLRTAYDYMQLETFLYLSKQARKRKLQLTFKENEIQLQLPPKDDKSKSQLPPEDNEIQLQLPPKDDKSKSKLLGHLKKKKSKSQLPPEDDECKSQLPPEDDDKSKSQLPPEDNEMQLPPKDDKSKSQLPPKDVESKLQLLLDTGVKILVNAISTEQYDSALKLVKKYPELATKNDNVLMAMARNFPREFDFWETLMCPSLDNICARVVNESAILFWCLKFSQSSPLDAIFMIFVGVLSFIYLLFSLLIIMLYFPFFFLYFLLCKGAALVAPLKRLEHKKKEHKVAKDILKRVCDNIEKGRSGTDLSFYYKRPILEAACQNAYEVVDEILSREPEAIHCKNEGGHDIIQLAVIHRSEKIYNLIYDIGKNLYRKHVDSSNNNLLHLAGRMAPSHKLNRRSGAALQLQSELQWREEVKNFVLPTCITDKNNFNETPEMVFTREHEDLVKEGEQWMKTTAGSCTITATLVTTIVFAAAITVPGGNNQTGIPMFSKEIAFIIFAISDAISLFTSTSAVLMFLSILTARFAEQDFLVRLPKRLIIGLCSLFLSTTAMMVAFSATLFLVFCGRRTWMLAPVCAFACLPIALFVTLQFPLVVDLFRSTYVRTLGEKINSERARFNPSNLGKYIFSSLEQNRLMCV